MKSLGFQGALQQPTQKWRRSKLGDTCTVEYELPYLQWRAFVPRIHSAHPENANLWLENIDVQQTGGPRCKIVLSYEPNDNPASNGELQMPGDANGREYVEEAGTMEVPIEKHPDFHDETKFPGKTKDALGKFSGFKDVPGEHNKFGVASFVVPTMTVRITTYSRNIPPPAIEKIGKLETPPGYKEATGGKKYWLILSGAVNGPRTKRYGAFWGTTVVYQYNPLGWDQDMYPVPSA